MPRDVSKLTDAIEELLDLEPFQGEQFAQEIVRHAWQTITGEGVQLAEELGNQYCALDLPTSQERRMYDSGIKLLDLSKGEERLSLALAKTLDFSSIASVTGKRALLFVCKEAGVATGILTSSSDGKRECEWQEAHLRRRLMVARKERRVEPTRLRMSLLAC